MKSKCSGVIMLESLIVVTVTIFILFFILAAFSILFQNINVHTIANETAAKVAQNYEYNYIADISSGKFAENDYTDIGPFRYFFENADEMKAVAQNKASEYALARLKSTTYTIAEREPQVKVSINEVALGRRYIEVTINGGYRVPLGGVLGYFKLNEIIDYEVYGYADCIDLSNYINTVDFTSKWTKSVDNIIFIETATSIMKLFGSIKVLIGG